MSVDGSPGAARARPGGERAATGSRGGASSCGGPGGRRITLLAGQPGGFDRTSTIEAQRVDRVDPGISWTPCFDMAECATATVPLDSEGLRTEHRSLLDLDLRTMRLRLVLPAEGATRADAAQPFTEPLTGLSKRRQYPANRLLVATPTPDSIFG